MVKTHEITTTNTLFQTLADGSRSFDIVKKDSNYQKGDYVLYHKKDETSETGIGDATILFKVTSVNVLDGLEDGNVIIALKVMDQ